MITMNIDSLKTGLFLFFIYFSVFIISLSYTLFIKGISEDEWRHYAQSLSIIKYVGLSALAPSFVDGGKFKFEFDKNVIDLKRGEFIAEVGPTHFHSAYFISYYLDRVLGVCGCNILD